MAGADEAQRHGIDAQLWAWRQGDCHVGEAWFAFRLDPRSPLEPAAVESAAEGADLAEEPVLGFMIASQTCDIVRPCSSRPYVEVCPLVRVTDDVVHQIARGGRPNYAYLPALAPQGLVADLDRVMTVEKAVVAGWKRTPGWTRDDEIRQLARALARKRDRFAFPDDFVALVAGLRERLLAKHDKQSPEGEALRALREIRAAAAPSWDAARVQVTLWFLRDADAPGVRVPWDSHLEKWRALVPDRGRFHVDALVLTLDDLTAREYVESDRLDLDHLSSRPSTSPSG